jgi:hypothetical protein
MSLIALFLAVGTAGATQALHSPSTAEEAGIRQAIFDYVAANALARRPVITRMRVSSITLQAKATGRHRYRKFARGRSERPESRLRRRAARLLRRVDLRLESPRLRLRPGRLHPDAQRVPGQAECHPARPRTRLLLTGV